MVKAMLHSLDKDGTHRAPLQDVEILQKVGTNDYLVRTASGVKCHALYNVFVGYFFVDDIYRIVKDEEGGRQ